MARTVVCIPAQGRKDSLSPRTIRKLRVAAYCRVSTEQDEQLNSLENQVNFYTEYITSREDYELAGIYADEGISGTSTKRRENFQRMITDCEAGKIDFVITKSISRFARNTQDCLTYSRKLKDLGIGIFFEKENINTMESTGELLFTILSSLAQEESRSISENCQWGIRSLFQQGVVHLNTKRFYGYDKNNEGKLVINPIQAKYVKWMYDSLLEGLSPAVMARILNEQNVPGCMGAPKWTSDTIKGILKNEKHKGDLILQKTYTTDYLTKKTAKNDGQLPQYYVSEDHEPIVSADTWEAAQLELLRRSAFIEEHELKTLDGDDDQLPFTRRVFCGVCGTVFWRRQIQRKNGPIVIWVCGDKYPGKNQKGGCPSVRLKEEELHRGFIRAWNSLVDNRMNYEAKWVKALQEGNPLEAIRARQMLKLTKAGICGNSLDTKLVNLTLEKVTVAPPGLLNYYFLDGTRIVAPIHEK